MPDPLEAFRAGILLVQYPFHARDYFSHGWPRERFHFDGVVCARYAFEIQVLREVYPELSHWRDDELVAVWEDWSQLCGSSWLGSFAERDVFFLSMVFMRCERRGVWPPEWSSVHHYAQGGWREDVRMLEQFGVVDCEYRNLSLPAS
ncbi:hypothetical protein [Deinococcus cellulosilyticus]|uniref:Uncharacterized protein n=1 Tax=Deinococcus cellulosilyticus (strain DSM 18568 / NBRC 106333 / KACC 11606 / 5516J-15) TaxID=1223518 RepID=A0A511MZX3_DEIC1|nr:hypothetical protein [Deinococcus cellulosilyticus]GEM46112.1 hypothetical protein DC3_17470 [Deinococcus cellulosilyticus NBRC 106333 = KACC 11606]